MSRGYAVVRGSRPVCAGHTCLRTNLFSRVAQQAQQVRTVESVIRNALPAALWAKLTRDQRARPTAGQALVAAMPPRDWISCLYIRNFSAGDEKRGALESDQVRTDEQRGGGDREIRETSRRVLKVVGGLGCESGSGEHTQICERTSFGSGVRCGAALRPVQGSCRRGDVHRLAFLEP